MAFTLKPSSTRGLFAAWGVYWLALLALTGRTLAKLSVVASEHGSVTLGLDGAIVRVVGSLNGQRVAGGSASLLSLSLWIAGPPLLLWLVWLTQRRRSAALAEGEQRPLLPRDRWTPTSYHEALRRETMREQDKA